MAEPSSFKFYVNYEGPMKMAYATSFTVESPITLVEVKKKALAYFWDLFNSNFPGRINNPHGSYNEVIIMVGWQVIHNDTELHERMKKTHNFQVTFSIVSHP